MNLDNSRKVPKVAEVTINKADLVTAVAAKIFNMPAGTVLDSAYLAVDTLFDPTTSAVIEVGSAAGTTNDIIASQNIFTGQALGGRAGLDTARGKQFTARGGIYAKYTSGGGLATAGKLRVVIFYHYANEAEFVQN
jgi:hypothetical protein